MAHLFTIDHIIQSTSLLWLLLAAVWLGSAPFVKPTVQQQSDSSRIAQLAVLTVVFYLLFGSPSTPAWFNQPLMPVTLFLALAGLALVLCGVAFSIWARLTLGENWSASATIKQNHTLVLRGPYRMVRHPIYTGLLIGLLGSALQHGLIRSFAAVLICAVGLWQKLSIEESFMIQRFGHQYLAYRKHVSALVPFLF
jgi:protein-S-isoprenylcysteine O-methyltransferase Ste14